MQNVCQLLLAGAYMAEKSAVSIYLFQTLESILTLRDEKQGMAVNNYRLSNPCFPLKIFKASRCRDVPHDCVQPRNAAITPPENIIRSFL